MTKIRRWGYSADDARIFELDPGEPLPAGYFDSPAKVTKIDEAAEQAHAIERRALLDRARDLGVETRGTQTNERLRERIAAAEEAEAEAPAAEIIGESAA